MWETLAAIIHKPTINQVVEIPQKGWRYVIFRDGLSWDLHISGI